MTKQFLLRAHSSVFATLPIFAKCNEAVADRRDGARRGRVGLNTLGRVAASAAMTMVVAAALAIIAVIINIITTTVMPIKMIMATET